MKSAIFSEDDEILDVPFGWTWRDIPVLRTGCGLYSGVALKRADPGAAPVSLTAKMADPSGANRLTSASARGDLTELQIILQNGADVNERNVFGRTALQVMKLGNPAIAEALLRAEADPNVRDPLGGLTILHDAARDGYADTLRVLVNHGADVNIQDNGGNLPLHLAAREGHLDVIGFLIERTTDPMRQNLEGKTAYDLATLHNRLAAAQWIQEYVHSSE